MIAILKRWFMERRRRRDAIRSGRHSVDWGEIADMVGDPERKLTTEELVRWKSQRDGDTALHLAVQYARHDVVAFLLASGADVNARNSRGQTPLHSAWDSDERPDLLEALLRGGADVHTADDRGWTVLHKAAEGGDPWLAALLLDRGVDPECRETSWGRTPIHWAAANGHTEVVRLLLDRGAEVDARVRRPRRYPEPPKDRPNPIEFSRKMVSSQGLGYLLCDGQTALHLAVLMGCGAAVDILLDGNADVDAVLTGCGAAVGLLLDRGADVNATDDRAHTPQDLALILDRGGAFVSVLWAHGGKSSVRESETPEL